MAERETEANQIQISQLGGLNESLSLANLPPGTFAALEGLYPAKSGSLERMPGKTLLRRLSAPILNIYQTFDARNNILVQTTEDVQLFTLDELMSRTPATTLTATAISEEDTMSKAIIVHAVAANTAGGTYTTASTWQQAPLSAIQSQLNADGTAAAFVTALAANRFTLSAGTYRFKGRSAHSDATAGIFCVARLYNVTTALPAWSGLDNETGPWDVIATATRNQYLEFEGDLTIAAPTQFEIQHYASGLEATNGFGKPVNLGSMKEIYRTLTIIKTA